MPLLYSNNLVNLDFKGLGKMDESSKGPERLVPKKLLKTVRIIINLFQVYSGGHLLLRKLHEKIFRSSLSWLTACVLSGKRRVYVLACSAQPRAMLTPGVEKRICISMYLVLAPSLLAPTH